MCRKHSWRKDTYPTQWASSRPAGIDPVLFQEAEVAAEIAVVRKG